MNKLTFAAIAATAIVMPVSADVTTVKNLYEGEPREITWENTLNIPASEFEYDVTMGDYLYITFEQTDGNAIELKSDGNWLPGSVMTKPAAYPDAEKPDAVAPEMKCYITKSGLETLRSHGLEICGVCTVKNVSVCNDGFEMPEEAVWGGYFWVDNWNTIEIYKTAFDSYHGERYMVIGLSGDNGDNTGYFMKVLTKWEPETVFAGNDEIAHKPTQAIVDMQGKDLKAALADVDALMIQSNPEGGSPYNLTYVAFTDSENGDLSTAAPVIEMPQNAKTDVYSVSGVCLRKNVDASEALRGLPCGLYIVNGRKIVK